MIRHASIGLWMQTMMKNRMKIQILHIKRNIQRKFKTYSMITETYSITENKYDILLEGTETPSFYTKPKTHKTSEDIITFRSTCNNTGSCSVRMSEFVV